MSRGSLLRAIAALVVGVGSVALAATQTGFGVVGGFIGVRVGLPGAGVELARALLPILVAVLFAALAIRFGIRALRRGATVRGDFAQGGKLLATVVWAVWAWLAFELWYRQEHLGWAGVFGALGPSLVVSAVAVAVTVAVERLVPWERAPRGIQHVGLVLVALVAGLTGLSAWCHRALVSWLALAPVVVVGLAFVVLGVRRVESGPRASSWVELGLASVLLAGPLWRLIG